ncbi:hypothetical protein Leryth_009119 [Lithospermum erythrorhizon]|nr:hypothetical protein Leryth_009119 [Lithospermum erythrorhizon]
MERFNLYNSKPTEMCGMGVPVSDYALREMLSCLVDLGRWDTIVDVCCSVGDGIQRDQKRQRVDVYGFIMGAISRKGEVEMALKFHERLIERGFLPDIVACNKILKYFCTAYCTEMACKYFDLILKVGPKPTIVTFSTLMNAYCKEGILEEAFKLYQLMLAWELSPDLVIYSILVDGFFKVGKLEEGHQLLSESLDRGFKLDTVLVSTLIDAHIRNGNTCN